MPNLDIKTDLKTTPPHFLASVKEKNTEEAQSNRRLLYKKLDKATKRNILHKNTASHRKSKFSRQLANSAS